MLKIDLRELAKRESERVEWKENVADVEDVVKSIVAFANDISNLGGGYVVCGAKETKDEAGFQRVEFIGLTASRMKEIENRTLDHCRERVKPQLIPITEEFDIANNDNRILVFIVPSSDYAHSYQPSSKNSHAYYIRIGRHTREAADAPLRDLLTKKKAVEPWDRRINFESTIENIDLVVFRNYLQQMNLWDPRKSLEDYFSPKEHLSSFVPPLTGLEKLTGKVYPRNFSLLMFGKNPSTLFDGAYSVFSIYSGTDRGEATAERHEIPGNIVEQAKRLIELLNTEAYISYDKEAEAPNKLKYPVRALQEAVVNAIVHRDYEVNQPIRVTVFSDRIEIWSPGSLPSAIDHKKFQAGKAAPFWRNQSFAYFFSKLQLAQSEGQGIPTIFRTMKEEGCPTPVFEVGDNYLLCILPAHPRHIINRELRKIEDSIILGNYADAEIRILELLKEDPYNFRSLELYCEVLNLTNRQDNLLVFIKRNNLNLDQINSSTLVILAECLSSRDDIPEAKELAQYIFNKATEGKLEEREIRIIAGNFRKTGQNEKAIEFIDKAFSRNDALRKSAPLYSNRARASMDLAKKCIDSGRNKDLSIKLKAKAWDQCRQYLSSAEKDLSKALELVKNDVEKDYIMRDIEFLNYMKEISKKPTKPGQHPRFNPKHNPRH